MADWKTYVKAAQNTARKQAPEVSRAAREGVEGAARRTGDYARAASRAVEGARREEPRDERERQRPRSDSQSTARTREHDSDEDRGETRRSQEDRGQEGPRRESRSQESRSQKRPTVDAEKLRKDAAAYATVAGRRVQSANIGPKILKALREALLIGGSLLVIWLVLSATGISIPFSAVLTFVIVIVVIAFGATLYANFRRRPTPEDDMEDRDEAEDRDDDRPSAP